jgi:DNA replication protein DnaC
VALKRLPPDWAKFLEDVPATTAILDRFLSHLELVTMRGKSYRLHKNGSPFTKDNPE